MTTAEAAHTLRDRQHEHDAINGRLDRIEEKLDRLMLEKRSR